MARDQLQPVLTLARQLGAALETAATGPGAPAEWIERRQRFIGQTGFAEPSVFAHAVAQAVTCGHFAVAADAADLRPAARQWLLDQADPVCQPVLHACLMNGSLDAGAAVDACSRQIGTYLRQLPAAARTALAGTGLDGRCPVSFFFERLLRHADSRARRRQGVYYTPPSIVQYVVRAIHERLRAEFALPDGLADQTTWRQLAHVSAAVQDGRHTETGDAPFVRLLDPAMGTGVFLLAAFDQIRQAWDGRSGWDEFVTRDLLARLCGQELLLPALVLAQLQLAARLGASGYRFHAPGKLQLHLGNTLLQPALGCLPLHDAPHPYTIVLGNPPFSGVSGNHAPWIRRLLHGQAPDGRPAADYFQIDGQPLGERKHWLEDDYVKFVRLAHWLVERASAGVVGFVTNHGFLDNTTFRGMRQQLLHTFPRATVIDLHGNTRTGERPPDMMGKHGRIDESVFGIEQGVAVSIWRRPPHHTTGSCIEHGDLWGSETHKLRMLDGGDTIAMKRLEPHSPYYLLVPRDPRGESEYARGVPLTEAMPVHSTAAVTARDSFVVAFEADELHARLALLCDPQVPDAEVRARYFTSSRSLRYAPGDTRGWKLADARQRLRADADWTRYIRECLYRPFDRRHIFWANWMIDWPRNAVMSHLESGDNLALVARRQVPASHACNYFWITDTIALDGLIRSDNRGSESVFPLFLCSDEPAPNGQHACRANFAPDFVDRCARAIGLAWNPCAAGADGGPFGARDLFHYIYALVHAPSYQQRFAAWHRTDFPRVFVPARCELFRRLAALGAELVDLHLLRTPTPATRSVNGWDEAVPACVRQPRFHNQRIYVNEHLSIGPVATEVWHFRAGAHQVCHKWLKDRSGRVLDHEDLTLYCQILAAIDGSLAHAAQIDHTITAHGGWPSAFAG